ncbi:hypothetical protein D3C80_2011310 [compost metagenome]
MPAARYFGHANGFEYLIQIGLQIRFRIRMTLACTKCELFTSTPSRNESHAHLDESIIGFS